MRFWEGRDLLSIDVPDTSSSTTAHGTNCCERHRRVGTTDYQCSLLSVVLVHPESREVLPLAPEPIRNSDAPNRNDCERAAAWRLIADVRRKPRVFR